MKQSGVLRTLAAAEIVLGALFAAGMVTFLKPCGPKEDGTFMHCHTAGQVLLAIAVLIAAAGIAGYFKKESGGALLPAVGILLSAAALLVPGTFISLCMMPEMRCRAVMRPGASVFAVLSLIVFAVHLAAVIRKSRS